MCFPRLCSNIIQCVNSSGPEAIDGFRIERNRLSYHRETLQSVPLSALFRDSDVLVGEEGEYPALFHGGDLQSVGPLHH